jgi:hypothetical protein
MGNILPLLGYLGVSLHCERLMRRVLLPVLLCVVFSGCSPVLTSLGLHRPAICQAPHGGNDRHPAIAPGSWCDFVAPAQGQLIQPFRIKGR